MSSSKQVTIDQDYLDALLRRANFHTTDIKPSHEPPAPDVKISKVEYQNLLQAVRQYQLLRSALLQGGLAPATLDLLVSSEDDRQDQNNHPSSTYALNGNMNDFSQPAHFGPSYVSANAPHHTQQCKYGDKVFDLDSNVPSVDKRIVCPPHNNSDARLYPQLKHFDSEEVDSVIDDSNLYLANVGMTSKQHTLYLTGFAEQTTYRDLLSVLKGGKILSITLRPERNALVTFVEGAAEYLNWAKRNDVYLNTKRIEVKWADRQYGFNPYIVQKIASGASRNVLIRSAVEKGITEAQIREDMEHIHNLVIVEIVFRDGDAYISTNSVNNALFARTCMLSRSAYKGCKIEFFRDECDVPLPMHVTRCKKSNDETGQKRARPITNRFMLLDINDGSSSNSDAENNAPLTRRVSDSDDEAEE